MVKKHKKNPKKSTLNVSLSYLEKESIINAIRENDEEAIKKICSQFPKATLNGIKYQITASSENCSKELSLHPLQAAILLEKISLIPHLAAITDPEYFNRKLKSYNGSLTLIHSSDITPIFHSPYLLNWLLLFGFNHNLRKR